MQTTQPPVKLVSLFVVFLTENFESCICPCEECVIKMMCTKNCKASDAVIQHGGRLTLAKYDTYKKYHDALHEWKRTEEKTNDNTFD